MKNEKEILIQGMSKIIDIPIEVLNMMIEENKMVIALLRTRRHITRQECKSNYVYIKNGFSFHCYSVFSFYA